MPDLREDRRHCGLSSLLDLLYPQALLYGVVVATVVERIGSKRVVSMNRLN